MYALILAILLVLFCPCCYWCYKKYSKRRYERYLAKKVTMPRIHKEAVGSLWNASKNSITSICGGEKGITDSGNREKTRSSIREDVTVLEEISSDTNLPESGSLIRAVSVDDGSSIINSTSSSSAIGSQASGPSRFFSLKLPRSEPEIIIKNFRAINSPIPPAAAPDPVRDDGSTFNPNRVNTFWKTWAPGEIPDGNNWSLRNKPEPAPSLSLRVENIVLKAPVDFRDSLHLYNNVPNTEYVNTALPVIDEAGYASLLTHNIKSTEEPLYERIPDDQRLPRGSM